MSLTLRVVNRAIFLMVAHVETDSEVIQIEVEKTIV